MYACVHACPVYLLAETSLHEHMLAAICKRTSHAALPCPMLHGQRSSPRTPHPLPTHNYATLRMRCRRCRRCAHEAALPHVSECNFCSKCHTGGRGAHAGAKAGPASSGAGGGSIGGSAGGVGGSGDANRPEGADGGDGAGGGAGARGRGGVEGSGSPGETGKGGGDGSGGGGRRRTLLRAPSASADADATAARRPRHWISMGVEHGGADANADIKPEYNRMFPSQPDINAKARLPNCSECVGCSTQLSHLADVSAFNHRFKIETGASSEWIFVAGAALWDCMHTAYGTHVTHVIKRYDPLVCTSNGIPPEVTHRSSRRLRDRASLSWLAS
eukprot:366144-Chlamydomonas_euryale.AAC.3